MKDQHAAVLLIDPSPEVQQVGREVCERLGMQVRVADGLSAGLRLLGEAKWVATLLSLDLPGTDLELVGRIRDQGTAGAVVLLAAAPSLRLAMEATAVGAMELLARPPSAEQLAEVLRGVASAVEGVPLPVLDSGAEMELVGASPELLTVFKAVGRVAGSGATVLITGESGTGKELVARAVHRASPRAPRPFVAVNCAAIPEDLLESELFGHERGAFTGAVARKIGRWERAQGGTLFLDEIGDMSLVLQAKILRVLQEREVERLGGEERIPVDVRVVAATHRDLPLLIREGEFREDLFYRLAVVRLHLPPLRTRAGDVRTLALHFAAEFARLHARPTSRISSDALERLATHDWPGNVRELRNVVERAVLQCTGEVLLPEHVSIDHRHPASGAEGEFLAGYSPSLSMADVEALHLRRVLEHVGNHYGHAADILGMHRNTVSRKAQEYGVVAREAE